jgi:hypothetical protein
LSPDRAAGPEPGVGREGTTPGEPRSNSMLGQPREYSPFVIPDGGQIDDRHVNTMRGILDGEYGHQDRAQKLVDLHFEIAKDVGKEYAKHQRETWQKFNDDWKEETRKDPELGGRNLDETVLRSKALIDQFGGNPQQRNELYRWLDSSGMSNNPGMLRLLNNIGKALNTVESFQVHGQPGGPSQGRAGGKGWYPSMQGGDR